MKIKIKRSVVVMVVVIIQTEQPGHLPSVTAKRKRS